jgi:hypothetical protein
VAKLVIRTDGVDLTLSTDLQDEIRRGLDLTTHRAIRIMADERGEVFHAARRRWPVKTGRSLAALEQYLRLQVGNGEITAGVRLPGIEYARWIRLKGKRTFVLTSYLRTPMRRASRRIAKRVEQELPDVLNDALPSNGGRG